MASLYQWPILNVLEVPKSIGLGNTVTLGRQKDEHYVERSMVPKSLKQGPRTFNFQRVSVYAKMPSLPEPTL